MGDVGHKLLAAFFVSVLFGDIVKHDEDTALFMVGEGGQIQLQCALTDHQFIFYVVGTLQG